MADGTRSRRTEPNEVPPDTTCFVIMPFGPRTDATGNYINFDEVYEHLIKAAANDAGITQCRRTVDNHRPGWIHPEMFHAIYTADVAIVDISHLNANVFYELGIRHALVGRVTVLIKEEDTAIPFNIQGMNVIPYTTTPTGFAKARQEIATSIRNAFGSTAADSPVHKVVPLKIGREPALVGKSGLIDYGLRGVPDKRIGLATGELRHVKDIDIWVNSENTYMQMARHFDPSVSGVIRYYGALRAGDGTVIDDLIANELAQSVGKNPNVPPGRVVPTGSGELERTNGVKHIFHAAAVAGQVGRGYSPIADLSDCVTNALELAEEDQFDATNPTSILFPLLGTGTARADVEEKAPGLIRAAIDHLAQHSSRITRVYFLVRDKRQLEVCRCVLNESGDVVRPGRAAQRRR
jgi:O-acetyl-ADP-ribose deacetylase (regulator of RNase III)